MVTVLRANGLRVVIFVNYHLTCPCPRLRRRRGQDRSPGRPWYASVGLADGMSRGDVRRAMRLVIEQQRFLLVRWEDIHGRPD